MRSHIWQMARPVAVSIVALGSLVDISAEELRLPFPFVETFERWEEMEIIKGFSSVNGATLSMEEGAKALQGNRHLLIESNPQEGTISEAYVAFSSPDSIGADREWRILYRSSEASEDPGLKDGLEILVNEEWHRVVDFIGDSQTHEVVINWPDVLASIQPEIPTYRQFRDFRFCFAGAGGATPSSLAIDFLQGYDPHEKFMVAERLQRLEEGYGSTTVKYWLYPESTEQFSFKLDLWHAEERVEFDTGIIVPPGTRTFEFPIRITDNEAHDSNREFIDGVVTGADYTVERLNFTLVDNDPVSAISIDFPESITEEEYLKIPITFTPAVTYSYNRIAVRTSIAGGPMSDFGEASWTIDGKLLLRFYNPGIYYENETVTIEVWDRGWRLQPDGSETWEEWFVATQTIPFIDTSDYRLSTLTVEGKKRYDYGESISLVLRAGVSVAEDRVYRISTQPADAITGQSEVTMPAGEVEVPIYFESAKFTSWDGTKRVYLQVEGPGGSKATQVLTLYQPQAAQPEYCQQRGGILWPDDDHLDLNFYINRHSSHWDGVSPIGTVSIFDAETGAKAWSKDEPLKLSYFDGPAHEDVPDNFYIEWKLSTGQTFKSERLARAKQVDAIHAEVFENYETGQICVLHRESFFSDATYILSELNPESMELQELTRFAASNVSAVISSDGSCLYYLGVDGLLRYDIATRTESVAVYLGIGARFPSFIAAAPGRNRHLIVTFGGFSLLDEGDTYYLSEGELTEESPVIQEITVERVISDPSANSVVLMVKNGTTSSRSLLRVSLPDFRITEGPLTTKWGAKDKIIQVDTRLLHESGELLDLKTGNVSKPIPLDGHVAWDEVSGYILAPLYDPTETVDKLAVIEPRQMEVITTIPRAERFESGISDYLIFYGANIVPRRPFAALDRRSAISHDLSMQLAAGSIHEAESNVDLTFTVKNTGSSTASGSLFEISIPHGWRLQSMPQEVEKVFESDTKLTLRLPPISSNGIYVLNLPFTPHLIGISRILASVFPDGFDPNLQNNSATAWLTVNSTPEARDGLVFRDRFGDAEWDPFHHRIYRSIIWDEFGNYVGRLAAVDPASTEMRLLPKTSAPPSSISLSSNGEFLYYGSENWDIIERINLEDYQIEFAGKVPLYDYLKQGVVDLIQIMGTFDRVAASTENLRTVCAFEAGESTFEHNFYTFTGDIHFASGPGSAVFYAVNRNGIRPLFMDGGEVRFAPESGSIGGEVLASRTHLTNRSGNWVRRETLTTERNTGDALVQVVWPAFDRAASIRHSSITFMDGKGTNEQTHPLETSFYPASQSNAVAFGGDGVLLHNFHDISFATQVGRQGEPRQEDFSLEFSWIDQAQNIFELAVVKKTEGPAWPTEVAIHLGYSNQCRLITLNDRVEIMDSHPTHAVLRFRHELWTGSSVARLQLVPAVGEIQVRAAISFPGIDKSPADDLAQFHCNAIAHEVPLLFRQLDFHNGGWRLSDWFGWIHTESGEYYYHYEHGWLLCRSNGNDDGFFYWDFSLRNWYWTSENVYPFMFRATGNPTWLLYLEGTSSPRWYFDYSLQEWVSD